MSIEKIKETIQDNLKMEIEKEMEEEEKPKFRQIRVDYIQSTVFVIPNEIKEEDIKEVYIKWNSLNINLKNGETISNIEPIIQDEIDYKYPSTEYDIEPIEEYVEEILLENGITIDDKTHYYQENGKLLGIGEERITIG